jgi:hypothetical protein
LTYAVLFLGRFRCSSGLLQGTSPAKQSAPNPPEQLLEDPFGAFRFTSPHSDEPTLLSLPHQLLMTLLLQKEE